MAEKPNISRLMIRDPYFPLGATPAEAANKYGSGVVFRVFRGVLGEVVAGNESFHYALETIIYRCGDMQLTPMLYIDNKNQDKEAQLKCVWESIALAIKGKLLKIVILSPETELLDETKKIDAGELKVETGRLAGHSLNPQAEIRQEAAKKTSIIAFYAYEHDGEEIKKMIELAARSGIKIVFNIREEEDHSRDILKNAAMIIEMAGGIFCNYPPSVWEVLEGEGAGK